MNRLLLMPALLIVATTLTAFANKQITIDLTTQTLVAKEGGTVFLRTSVSTGMYGHATPTGRFRAFDKVVNNKSTLYPKRYGNGIDGGAPMPYTIRVTGDGVAIHQGTLPRLSDGSVYPDSHGCIRVSRSVARKLFNWTTINTPINIVGETVYKDRVNNLRERYANGENRAVEDYEDEFDDWGESYGDEGSHGFTYQEGDMDYVDSL